jgi:hypothetical protein
MFTCYTSDSAAIVHGTVNENDRWGTANRPTTCHLESVGVSRKVALEERDIIRLTEAARPRFVAATKAAFGFNGVLVRCSRCERTVRRAGVGHHQHGMRCISATSRLLTTRRDYTFDEATRQEVPQAIVKVVQITKKKRGSKEMLVDAKTIPTWAARILAEVSSYGTSMDLVCVALRERGATCLVDRNTYSSPWRMVAEVLASDLASDLLKTAQADLDERDFALSLLSADVQQFHAYMIARAPALIQSTYDTKAAAIAALKTGGAR